jgi:ribonuclease Y
MLVSIWFALLLGVMGALTGYLAGIVISGIRAAAAEKSAEDIIQSAHREAEVIRKDATVQARDAVIRVREEVEQRSNEKRKDLLLLEERMSQRETNLERKFAMLEKKEEAIDLRLAEVETAKLGLEERRRELELLQRERRELLQRIAAMTQEQARELLMKDLEEDLRHDAATLIRRIQEETRESAEREARNIITNAIERYAADQVAEVTTTAVPLPSDEMKGRIIGREGRNIRALEAATGVNILIDDTPEMVLVSGFDPVRREVARRALQALISDGRIHPSRIEEVVAKAQSEIDESIVKAGEDAVYALRIHGLPPEITRTVGRLKFRYSYGQNVLDHSVEMGHLMGMMASELHLNAPLARRIGLLHDVGKALDHNIEGGHALIGADLLKKHGESPVVVNAVASHHNDVESESPYAVLTKAADAITAARPGARSETTHLYLKRLEKLEQIANGFRGVKKSYALQAGREVRVIVEPHQITDDDAVQLAHNISRQIEHDLEYPGQIKVTVVRETRCVEYAK